MFRSVLACVILLCAWLLPGDGRAGTIDILFRSGTGCGVHGPNWEHGRDGFGDSAMRITTATESSLVGVDWQGRHYSGVVSASDDRLNFFITMGEDVGLVTIYLDDGAACVASVHRKGNDGLPDAVRAPCYLIKTRQ